MRYGTQAASRCDSDGTSALWGRKGNQNLRKEKKGKAISNLITKVGYVP